MIRRRPSSANALIWELFHAGKLTVGGREFRLGNRELPTPRVAGDAVVWSFSKSPKVDMIGPDPGIVEIRQYKDRIEFTVPGWAHITIETT